MAADWYLPDRDAILEFFEADDALELHELVYSLVVRLLLNELDKLSDPLFIFLLRLNWIHRTNGVSSEGHKVPNLVLHDLLAHLSLPNAQPYNSSNAYAHKGHHKHEQYKCNHPKHSYR